MSIEISMFIEYVLPTSHIIPVWGQNDEMDVPTSASHILSLTGKSFSIGRDHNLFETLAGIRSGLPARYPPRGIPPVMSLEVSRSYFCPIINDDDARSRPGIMCERRSDAEAYVKKGISHYGKDRPGARNLVSNPQWRNPSWLMGQEVEAAIAAAPPEAKPFSPAFEAVLASLRSLEARLGSSRTRLVFWFDSE